jgi:hypothetical protein
VTADERWSHLPEPLKALLRELRAKAAARVRARLDEMNRAYLARRWVEGGKARGGVAMTNREKAAELRARGLTFRLIGLELGISRERARQLLLPLPPRTCRTCKGPLAGHYGRRYCRAPCLPPSSMPLPPTGRPVGRPRKRPEIAGPPRPPRGRGRPRKAETPAEGKQKSPKNKGEK